MCVLVCNYVFTLSEKVAFFEKVFGKGGIDRKQRNLDLPCPNPKCASYGKEKKKFVILVTNDCYKCWVCSSHGRNVATIIKKFFPRYLNEYLTKFGGKAAKRDLVIDSVEREEDISLPAEFKLLACTASRDPDITALRKYLTRRRIDEQDLWRFKFGFTESDRTYFRRVIMPSFDREGKLNYFTARAVDSSSFMKYKNPPVEKVSIVYNDINIDWSRRLVLCEGPFDLVKCGDNAVPMLGSDLDEDYELFVKILVNSTPVAVALDGDMWTTKTQKIVKKLMEYDIDTVVVDTRGIEDPGAVTKKEFKQLLDAAKPMVWEDSLKSKLERATLTHARM